MDAFVLLQYLKSSNSSHLVGFRSSPLPLHKEELPLVDEVPTPLLKLRPQPLKLTLVLSQQRLRVSQREKVKVGLALLFLIRTKRE